MTHLALFAILFSLTVDLLAQKKEPAEVPEKAADKTVEQKLDLQTLGTKLKAAVANGEMTEEEAFVAWKKAVAKQSAKNPKADRKMAMMKKGRIKKGMMDPTFYAIIIGRLKSKDVELGEFEMDVDYVTSIYGDRKLKDTIIGKTVKITGVSGTWLDTLLLIKRGESIKLRSGTLIGTTVSMSPKAPVLERTVPFDPDVYPVPPEGFRGFRGIVTGKIESKSDQGYELTLRVNQVEEVFDESKASKAQSIEGRLMDVSGFFTGSFRPRFDDLKLGDTIRIGAAHREPIVDTLEVTRVLEKVK